MIFTRQVTKCAPHLNAQVIQKWQSVLDTRYAEPHRHYHNMFHMSLLSQLYDSFVQPLLSSDDERLKFVLAIWFHDVVYDAQSSTNEEDSSKVFGEFASEAAVKDGVREHVERMILDTKRHLPSVDGDNLT